MELEQPYRDQVVDAYGKSLSTTFLSTIFLTALMVAVILPLKLPRLEKK
jgi:hypothetical protein